MVRRIAVRAAVAFVTFTTGIALGSSGRGLRAGLQVAPAELPATHMEIPPPGAKALCEVDGVPMYKESVPILYGYAPHAFPYELRPGYFQAKKQFPHASRWHHAGCVLQDRWFEEVDVCSMCRAAQSVWAATPMTKK
jgi:hypothetical protein